MKRESKKGFENAIKQQNDNDIKSALNEYIFQQQCVRKAIEDAEEKRATHKSEAIFKDGRHNYNVIWKLRKLHLVD